MKVLVVLCAAVACAVAKPGVALTAGPLLSHGGLIGGLGYSSPLIGGLAGPAAIATPAIAGPAYAAHSYATHSYAAPALLASRTILSAPAVAVAPAVVAPPAVHTVAAAPAVVSTHAVHAAPAIVAARTVAAAPAVVAAAPAVVAAPAVTKTQYHAQNEHGEAAYGHSEPGQTHNAVQDAHGNKVGSYSYLNPHDGQVHRTDYVADAHGYRVAANDLPLAPVGHAIHKRSAILAASPLIATHTVAAAPAWGLARSTLVPAVTPWASAHVIPSVAHSSWAVSPLVHTIHKRSAIWAATPLLTQTPGSTALLGHAAIAAPAVIASRAIVPAAAPLVAAAPIVAAAPVAVAHHGIPATLTTITNNPGHAVSYRVD